MRAQADVRNDMVKRFKRVLVPLKPLITVMFDLYQN